MQSFTGVYLYVAVYLCTGVLRPLVTSAVTQDVLK